MLSLLSFCSWSWISCSIGMLSIRASRYSCSSKKLVVGIPSNVSRVFLNLHASRYVAPKRQVVNRQGIPRLQFTQGAAQTKCLQGGWLWFPHLLTHSGWNVISLCNVVRVPKLLGAWLCILCWSHPAGHIHGLVTP